MEERYVRQMKHILREIRDELDKGKRDTENIMKQINSQMNEILDDISNELNSFDKRIKKLEAKQWK